jgi:hypothetical protein
VKTGDNRGEADLTQVADIKNHTDRAIIESFKYAESKHLGKGILFAGAIKKIVGEKYSIADDEVVQSRIRTLHKRGILKEIRPNPSSKDKRKQYVLNEEFEYKYICGPLPSEGKSIEIPVEVRRHHTENLHEAIKTWIVSFPEPKAEFLYGQDTGHINRYNFKICESDILFCDLKNHLPQMGCSTLDDWLRYKQDTIGLEKLKDKLLLSIMEKISECFRGFKLMYVSDQDHGINDHECYLLPKLIYDLVFDFGGRVPGQEAYDNHEMCVTQLQENTELVDKNSAIWRLKGVGEMIRVPREEREKLEEGITSFMNLVDNIMITELIRTGKDIMRKVEELKKMKEGMIKDLKDLLQYYCFQGECNYLSGF